ncbi:hypothetical protein HDE_09354 [Halotydeus destructor]|nr:hypothetical protein HDE_09354 [Halotydeus destructor]
MNEVKDEDVLIIDIECIQRDSRGVDIGRMLHEANFDFTIMEQPKVVGPISEQLEELFVSSYLEQWKEDNGDLFDPELDNVQHVMLESKLNVLTTALSYCAGNFESLKEDEFTEFNDQILQYFAERKELYLSYKSSLISSLSS